MIEEMDFIEHGNLKAYITSDSFIIEKKLRNEISDFELDLFNLYVKDKWEALLELAFLNSNNFASSINILRIIASSFVKKIAFSPEINFKISSISIDIKEDEFHDLLAEIPFIDGIEYIDEKWIFEIYKHLNNKLNKLKQICNHPSQYYGDSLYEVEKSAKFIELKNICDKFFDIIVNTRINIMHAKKDYKTPFLEKEENALYAVKFYLLYRVCAISYIGFDKTMYQQQLLNCISIWESWETVYSDFMKKLHTDTKCTY